MINPREIYNLLLDYSQVTTPVKEILIGLTWTMCEGEGIGLCMSPAIPTRTLSWSGTLTNKPILSLASWIHSWDAYKATVGMAVVNSAINNNSELAKQATPIFPKGSANLAVFEYFLPLITGKRVAIIGRYPRLEQYAEDIDMTIIERQPSGNDLPDPACEYILPESEWVFLTATSIVNKTFPRLVELSQNAKLVLMGPTVPWLPELAQMGIDYLAGVKVTNEEALRQTIAQGGGVRIFETGVQYGVLNLSA
jgi:uncharacterized protein (DUF4213/DUF364 family)